MEMDDKHGLNSNQNTSLTSKSPRQWQMYADRICRHSVRSALQGMAT